MKRSFVVYTILMLALVSCTLRIGGPNKIGDSPAPTTIPLVLTAEPLVAPEIVPPPSPIALPQGFGITLYADRIRSPRMLAIGPDGELYAAERGAGRIIRLPDRDGDGQADGVEVVADGLNGPSSLAFYQDGSLYVAETTRILRFSERSAEGLFINPQVVVGDLPDGGHNTRTVLFSPDWSRMFVSVGSSCNVCDESDPRRAAILRYNPDGSGMEIFSTGLRNAVGITFRPGTDELWATNNGRDMLGDDLPPETIDLVHQGTDFGWPRCHAGRISDPDFGGADACDGVAPPVVEMQAHSAPLGLTFYTGEQFPPEYQGDLFVAFHGSWNRSVATGYKVVRIPMQDGSPGPVQDFATGWLGADGSSWGRPVDVITGKDGSLFVSDDGGRRIWRIFYTGP
ncbi:MAG TPA: PQQ-dependent sugar dehydrogenase [Anaerolineales bacterium]|nr:PQQ-dependent sugar dehydrogenase [Anaerolineales bacterium]